MPDLPSQAQVVIIGGGVGGCSIAYHLSKMGWMDVVVLERDELTSGSTWHSAGLVGQLRSDANLTRMIRYSTDLYRQLGAETGVESGWREVGGIRLASSPERMEELKRQVGMARAFGMPMELITPREALELFPIMDLTDVQGAVYTPTDGMIEPYSLTMALMTGAKNCGVQFHTHTNVTAISLKNGRVDEVVTNRGTIKTEVVVNAAGMWGHFIGKLVSLNLPIVPMAHLYAITKPIGGVSHDLPTLRDPDLLVYWREEVGGLITGGYERHPQPWGMYGIPDDFNSKLLPPDWDRFEELMVNSIRRVPLLEKAEIKLLLNGPEGFTPDGEYLLGPTEVKGFWVACAFCAHGLAGAGGIGKVMAEWIIDGNPEWDIWRLDLRRFGPNYASMEYMVARTHETTSEYYDIHYPGEERKTCRPLRLSPAYYRLQEWGASFGEKTGWERPNWFTPHEAKATHGHQPRAWGTHNWSPAIGYEHLKTRETAGLFDETSFSKIEVRGPDALDVLQYLCANDIDKPIGTVVYTQMLNPRGGIETDFTVTRIANDRFLIVTGTALLHHDISWIRLNIPDGKQVIVEDVTSNYFCFGLWGPKARAILQKATKDDVSNEAFPYMTAKEICIGDVPVLALRVTYVGELGWEFYGPIEYGQRAWDILWEAGEPEGMVPAGYRAIDTLRLEKGYRYWSADHGPDYTPYEAGVGFAVRLNKGDFIGREALAQQKEHGLTRKLCCLSVGDDSTIMVGKEPIYNGDEVVGWTTSGCYGYSVRKSITYAYLPIELTLPGTELEILFFGERVKAIVEKEPLWDPKGERIKM